MGRVSRRARFGKSGVYGRWCLVGKASVGLEGRVERRFCSLRVNWSRYTWRRKNHRWKDGIDYDWGRHGDKWWRRQGLVGGIQEVGSTVGPCPKGGVELEEAPFGPLSRANSSAKLVVMSVASWLTVLSSAAMRAWSSEVDDVCTFRSETRGGCAPEDVGGGRCIEAA
ncbi:hypothetical protein CRG98_023823 [Punica granatum]|uniref:Uncharacterized protein n=1 Tax=Punica granatum TaxID=22663 RepID=A0A2I0JHQ5_PUNGR|nr:hypothetical protein CRG98_023823 [Punica granatum]